MRMPRVRASAAHEDSPVLATLPAREVAAFIIVKSMLMTLVEPAPAQGQLCDS
jgi:hypothetical protein